MWGAQNSANYLYKKLLDEVNCSFKTNCSQTTTKNLELIYFANTTASEKALSVKLEGHL